MTSTQFARAGALKTESFDMDSFFDFNQSTTQPSPAPGSSSTPKPEWNVSPFDNRDERQQFSGPSHDYNLHKQQVGLPVGSMANMPQGMYDGYNSGMGGDMGGFGWGSGIDIDADVNMDFNTPHSAMAPTMFFPPQSNATQSDNFVDPNNIGGHEEPASNVGRLWPGMHSQQAQQAAMQKAAQHQAMQQRQMKMQAQHAQYRQAAQQGSASHSQASSQQSNGHGKRPSHVSEPHVEESISRLLNQMRQNSTVSGDDDEGSPGAMLPHIARMKKDEEEMDEDERLLASEEGKKLSSKERRQLRNKVSARAFRSRRKEYIGQLEGEVAMKAQENSNLRNDNAALAAENDRYRTLIETLLRHPAFTPFINDISKDPSVLGPSPQQHQHQQQQQAPSAPAPTPTQQQAPPSQSVTPTQQDVKPEFMNFDASQLQVPPQQPQQQQQQQQGDQHVGLAMIPENDFSKLNLNGFNSMNFNGYNSVNAYAVVAVPKGPDPVDLLTLSEPADLACAISTASSATATCTSHLTVLLAKLDGAANSMISLDAGA